MAGKNIEKNYALPSSEGLTHPSTSLYRPLGLFLEEKRKRKRSRGLHFPRG